MKQAWKQKNALYWTLFLGVLCFGGFFDWACALLSVVIGALGIVRMKKSAKAFRYREWSLYLIYVFGMGLLLAMFTAVDRGMNFVGILRFLPVGSWLFLCMQYEESERMCALNAVPDVGAIGVLIGCVAYMMPGLRDLLWMAGRLGGPFQYSNTFACFLLIGMMLLTQDLHKNIPSSGRVGLANTIQWYFLLFGILLTGSRSVIILTILVLLLEMTGMEIPKEQRKVIRIRNMVAFVGGVTGAVVVVTLTGSFQNFARLATVFSSNSTLYGRLLYWQDALPQILKHPLGIGYMGYSYLQNLFQRGIYHTMFLHNDFLQAFLDAGWLGGLAVCLFFAVQIKKSENRLILGILALHALVDFDLQYPVIWFVVVLLCQFGTEREGLKKSAGRERMVYLSGIVLVSLLFFVPFWANYRDHYEKAIYFYPGYTSAKELLLYRDMQNPESVAVAESVLRQNPYVAVAYEIKAYNAYMQGDVRGFAENKREVLKLSRYELEQYQSFIDVLERFAESAEQQGLSDVVAFCKEEQKMAYEHLMKVQEETLPFAYKIKDKPDFTLIMPEDVSVLD